MQRNRPNPQTQAGVFAILQVRAAQQNLHWAEKTRGLERIVGGRAGTNPHASPLALPVAKIGLRHAVGFRQEAVADKPVVPVVRIANLDFVFAFANNARRNGRFPRRAPRNAAIDAVDEDMGETARQRADGEGECGIVKLWKYGIMGI